MSFDDIKAHLDRLFAYRPHGSAREQAVLLRESLIEFKVGLDQLRAALAVTERELDGARRELADYQRRGSLAEGIGDSETVRVATEFTERSAAKVDLLERKVLVQRDEVHLAEREYERTRTQYERARQGVPLEAQEAVERDRGLAGDGADDIMMDRRAREAAVEAQLAHLKKQLGRE